MFQLKPFPRSVHLFNFAFWRAVRWLYAGPDVLLEPNKNKLAEVVLWFSYFHYIVCINWELLCKGQTVCRIAENNIVIDKFSVFLCFIGRWTLWFIDILKLILSLQDWRYPQGEHFRLSELGLTAPTIKSHIWRLFVDFIKSHNTLNRTTENVLCEDKLLKKTTMNCVVL